MAVGGWWLVVGIRTETGAGSLGLYQARLCWRWSLTRTDRGVSTVSTVSAYCRRLHGPRGFYSFYSFYILLPLTRAEGPTPSTEGWRFCTDGGVSILSIELWSEVTGPSTGGVFLQRGVFGQRRVVASRVFPVIAPRNRMVNGTAHRRYRDNAFLLRPIIRLRIFSPSKQLCLRGHSVRGHVRPNG